MKEGSMRPKDFPRLLFDTIHKAVGGPPIKKTTFYHDWQFFPIVDRKGKVVAHIGWSQSLSGVPGGTKSTLAVWDSVMFEPLSSNSKELRNPLLEIVGGAERVGIWAAGQGDLLHETVNVRAGGYFSSHGKDIGSPTVSVFGEILILAHSLYVEARPTHLAYWEAFRNPDLDYDESD